MPSFASPPNPCLVAVLLVIQSRSGPRLVFHYPPEPLAAKTSDAQDIGYGSTSSGELSSSDIDPDNISTEDEELVLRIRSQKDAKSQRATSTRSRLVDQDEDEGSSTENFNRQGKEWLPSYEPLFGLEGLVTLLTPRSRLWHKRKFELEISDLCFLGWPGFIREDGTWQKRRVRRKERRDGSDTKPPDAGQDTVAETNTEREDSS